MPILGATRGEMKICLLPCSTTSCGAKTRWLVAVLVCSLLSACTFLGNRNYVQQNFENRGIKRVALFIQRWPAYLQLPNQDDPGADFIKESTLFRGPWRRAGLTNSRAVDVLDINDEVMADLFLQVFTEKGYQPYLAGAFLSQPGLVTVAKLMATVQEIDRGVDALLFCFYSPAAFYAKAKALPKDQQNQSHSLQELINVLTPGGDGIIWAGPRASQAPPNSISHAFIYISVTMFKAYDWLPLWEVADSNIGGRLRVAVPTCPPGPTAQNYWADAAIIQRLMCNNLRCRLKHMIPNAF